MAVVAAPVDLADNACVLPFEPTPSLKSILDPGTLFLLFKRRLLSICSNHEAYRIQLFVN